MEKEKILRIKNFLHNFDFANPSLDYIPEDFFKVNEKLLTKEERGIYSGIVLLWLNNKYLEVVNPETIQKYVTYNLYQLAKLFIYLIIFVLITGNILNYIFIEVYHSIL